MRIDWMRWLASFFWLSFTVYIAAGICVGAWFAYHEWSLVGCGLLLFISVAIASFLMSQKFESD